MDAIAVCRVEELPAGTRRLVRTPRRGVVGVFNIGGDYRAVKNSCPHAGAELCRGSITGTATVDDAGNIGWNREGEILRCPWHGWEFDLLTGRTIAPSIKRVAVYSVTVEEGMVMLHV